MDKYERRRQRLIELRDTKCGGNGAELARKIGRDPSYVTRMLYQEGKAGKKRIADEMIEIIETAFLLPRGWLDQDHSTQSVTSNVEEAPDLRPFLDVAVVGTVQGGDNGFFTELEYPVGHGEGSITYPAKDENSYALRVRGDSMRPRIKNGEFIVVEPNHAPQPGDDVVVCLLDGRKMVKELLYMRDGEITLGSINNGHGNISVASDQVDKMHYVAAIIPRGAFYKS
ncbi:MAG: S24 family peptidase [Pseudomonadota bacterium]